MSEKIKKYIINHEQFKNLSFEDEELLQACIGELNKRIEYINSKEFDKLCSAAKKIKLFSAEREVQKIIQTSQENTKKFSKSLEELKPLLETKINEFDYVAGVYEDSTDNKNKEISDMVSRFKEFPTEYSKILESMKAQKTATKDTALEFGIATKTTINRTIKYMVDDLSNIKDKMSAILQSPEDKLSISDIKSLLDNENKHSYNASLKKIKISNNKGLGLSRALRPAITKAKKIGSKHSEKLIIFKKTEDIKENFISSQQNAMNSMYESCRTDASKIAESYKSYFSDSQEQYDKFLGLLENCAILSAQNKYQDKTIKSISLLKSNISKIDFSKIKKEMRLLSTQNADKDVKKRNKSVGAKIVTALINIGKAIGVTILWILGIAATLLDIVADFLMWLFQKSWLVRMIRSAISNTLLCAMWIGIYGVSVAAFS